MLARVVGRRVSALRFPRTFASIQPYRALCRKPESSPGDAASSGAGAESAGTTSTIEASSVNARATTPIPSSDYEPKGPVTEASPRGSDPAVPPQPDEPAAPPPPVGKATDWSAEQPPPRSALTISEEEEAPPPMEWEPGVAGTVQKGLSAVVIALGAAAFGVCAFGAYWALFPSPSNPSTIFDEATDKVKVDPEVADQLGTPVRAFGADFGGGEGRRTFVQSWEVDAADGSPAIQIKFNVQGPQGRGVIHAQAPAHRKRGQFNFIIFEDRGKRVHYVLDQRPTPTRPPAPAPAA